MGQRIEMLRRKDAASDRQVHLNPTEPWSPEGDGKMEAVVIDSPQNAITEVHQAKRGADNGHVFANNLVVDIEDRATFHRTAFTPQLRNQLCVGGFVNWQTIGLVTKS